MWLEVGALRAAGMWGDSEGTWAPRDTPKAAALSALGYGRVSEMRAVSCGTENLSPKGVCDLGEAASVAE